MATFEKQFTNADEYEKWLLGASDRINVLVIENSPVTFDSKIPLSDPVVVRYHTRHRLFIPPKSTAQKYVEIAFVAAAFFGLFLYLALYA